MPTPRMPKKPSTARLNSAVRKANTASRKLQSDLRKVERDLNKAGRELKRAGNKSRTRPSVTYTPSEQRFLSGVHEESERLSEKYPDRRDVFLCHAWEDRRTVATELDQLLNEFGASTWFSENDMGLGVPMLRQIDKGLSNSRIGIVLVTPNFLAALAREGVANRELSALLATERLIPVAHGVSYEELQDASPLLASRAGLSTAEDTLEEVATKIAESVEVG